MAEALGGEGGEVIALHAVLGDPCLDARRGDLLRCEACERAETVSSVPVQRQRLATHVHTTGLERLEALYERAA
jgi:hypothetical protein